MDPTPAETAPPGCLVILMPLSVSMADDARVWLAHRFTSDGEAEIRDLPKSVAARFLADELIEALANTLAGGYQLPLDVAVLGYNANDDGSLNLVSLLNGAKLTSRLLPMAEVAALPAEPRGREGDPRKWCSRAECAGDAPAAAALAEVYKFVSLWLTGRHTARPPVVLHVTDGSGLDSPYRRVARSFGLLSTGYGPARLLHIGLDATTEPTLCGMWTPPVADVWARLFRVSAQIPAEPDGRAMRYAVSVNDWSIADVWSALFDLEWSDTGTTWTDGDTNRFDSATARGMWTQKMGNTPEQWEDAYATEPGSGVAVVADGASSGIYCRTWADRLAKRFITDRPNLRDPVDVNKWVHGLRAEWRAAIDYDKLNWSKKAKVDETGAAATFLALELGPADDNGNRPWRASAVGDASLFWIRRDRLRATFPVVAADQFGSAPMLIRSNAGFKTLTLNAAGTCKPGDRFLLATDAVAARLFKSAAATDGPDWARFETIDETAWRDELDVLRKSNDMVNDDCTLVTLRVAGGDEPPASDEWPVANAGPPPTERIVIEEFLESVNDKITFEDFPRSSVADSGRIDIGGELSEELASGDSANGEVPASGDREVAGETPAQPGDSRPLLAENEPHATTDTDGNEQTPSRDGFSDSTTDKPV